MKNRYRHLTPGERDQLACLRSRELSLRAIARVMARDPATILRELRRNAPPVYVGYYLSQRAQLRADSRRRLSSRRQRLRDRWVRYYVRRQLKRGWSPELIAGRLRRLRPEQAVSHEAIYQWIYVEERTLIPCLVRRHRKRFRRGYSRKHAKPHIPGRVAIAERPVAANRREQSGHWEADTMYLRRGKEALQVIVDRKSRYTILNLLNRKTAAAMRIAMNRSLCRLPQRARRTITYDNGTENSEHLHVNTVLGTRSFFCRPYASQERGTVENTAGLVRRFFPLKRVPAMIQRKGVKTVQRWLNNRPRVILHFQTPGEIFRPSVALRP